MKWETFQVPWTKLQKHVHTNYYYQTLLLSLLSTQLSVTAALAITIKELSDPPSLTNSRSFNAISLPTRL